MKLELEASGTIESVNGAPARLWKGKTASGIDVVCWIALIRVAKDADNREFERELREVKVDRQLTSFDMRML